MGLYEHIILESLEMGERDLGRELLRTTEPMIMLKADQPERYLKLEHLCQRPFFNASDAYEMGSSKEKRYRTFEPDYFCFASKHISCRSLPCQRIPLFLTICMISHGV